MDITKLINSEKYPITDLESEKGKKLILDCHKQLKENSACILPDFIDHEVISIMAQQAEKIANLENRGSCSVNPYGTQDKDSNYPDSHPLNKKFTSCLGVVAYDLIPKQDLVRQLYENDTLTEFLRIILDLQKLYRFADEFQALNITVMKEDDEMAWHYDSSDFVITLLLQEPLQGGEFEFAPLIRTQNNENFEDVQKLYEGTYQDNQLLWEKAGTLVLFKGGYSLHRVRKVLGKQKRLIAIFSYDQKPNFTSTNELNALIYGERVANIVSQRPTVKY